MFYNSVRCTFAVRRTCLEAKLLAMFEPPSPRIIGIWTVGALLAGGAVLASGRQSWYPAVIILLLTMCVTVLAQDN